MTVLAFFRQFWTSILVLYSYPLKSNAVNPDSAACFWFHYPSMVWGERVANGGIWECLAMQAHEEKSQFGKQRWNRNLWSPFCPCRPVIPTVIKVKERNNREVQQITPTSKIHTGLTNAFYFFLHTRNSTEKRQLGSTNWDLLFLLLTEDQNGFRGFQRIISRFYFISEHDNCNHSYQFHD